MLQAHQDSCDYTYANEMSIKEALKVYRLLGKEENVRLIDGYGQHHGLDDITTYFDWFDRQFGRKTGYAACVNQQHLPPEALCNLLLLLMMTMSPPLIPSNVCLPTAHLRPRICLRPIRS